MPDFLILRKTGPQPTDLEVCTIIQGKGGDEGEDAITEGATAGDGRYLAVSMGNTTERDLTLEPVLREPEPEPPADLEEIPRDEVEPPVEKP
jgi:hypothetical protein